MKSSTAYLTCPGVKPSPKSVEIVERKIIRHLSWYFILPQTDRRANAVIAATVCASKNGRNHFHLTRFCCGFCRGGGSDPHLVVMTKSPAQNWWGKSRASLSGKDRNVQTQEGRAGWEEEDSTLCGSLRSSCPPYQRPTDPLCLRLSGWDWFDLTVVFLPGLSLFFFHPQLLIPSK